MLPTFFLFVFLPIGISALASAPAENAKGTVWVFWFFLNLPIFALLGAAIRQYTSDFHITNKRLITKVGILSRQTNEILLKKIETVTVNQGPIARMVDCGDVQLTGTGSAHKPIRQIAAPVVFRTYLTKAIAQEETTPLRLNTSEDKKQEARTVMIISVIIWFVITLFAVFYSPSLSPPNGPFSKSNVNAATNNGTAGKEINANTNPADTVGAETNCIDRIIVGAKDNNFEVYETEKDALASLPSLPPGNTAEAERLNPLGLKALKEKNFSQAVSYFKAAAQADPSNAKYLSNLGFAEMYDGSLDEAKHHTYQSLELAPEREVAWDNLGQVLAKQGKKEEGIACFLVAYHVSNGKTLAYLESLEADEDPVIREVGKLALEKVAPANGGDIDSAEMESNLQQATWTGTYEFNEFAEPNQNLDYQLVLSDTGKGMTMKLKVDGFQTVIRAQGQAKIEGNKCFIIYKSNYKDNDLNVPADNRFKPDAVLLTLERKNDKLITNWGELSPMDMHKRPGVYFSKGK